MGADEKILLALASAGWIGTRASGVPLRRAGSHALLVTIAGSLLPHVMKSLFNQTRPDRKTGLGHINGVPFSGEQDDSFPSDHALLMGALASAVSAVPTVPRRLIRTVAVGLSLTRIAVSRIGRATWS